MTTPLRIALAGLGTVGVGVIKLLAANHDLITRRAGRRIEIVAISSRDRARDRGVDISKLTWVDDPTQLAAHGDVDVVVELIGGSDDPALTLARNTLAAGRALVTANKAMIAHHGLELAESAERAGAAFKYEAAVAGGVPVIKGLREGAAANILSGVFGILNGTCNYILSTMESGARDFAEVLSEAQALGYAESDPSFDIDGIDAAHKLSILASLAFGTAIDFDGVDITGIRHVIAADIVEARALDHRIRLVGMASAGIDGLSQRVLPCLVPLSHPLAHVTGPLNAVVAEGNFVGRLFFQGRGAGEGPTASAVVADLIDIARGETGPAFAMPVASLTKPSRAAIGGSAGRSYLRFIAADRPGVLAEITAAMRDGGVSIEMLSQRGVTAGGAAVIALVTHECKASNVARALSLLDGSDSLLEAPMRMHILKD